MGFAEVIGILGAGAGGLVRVLIGGGSRLVIGENTD
jgi:hypothetical protein